MQTCRVLRASKSIFGLIVICLLWLPAGQGLAAEYLSVEDALSRLANGQTVPGQRAGYVSAEDALSQANQQLQQRQAARSATLSATTRPSTNALSALPESPYYSANPYPSFPAGGIFPGNGWPGNAGGGWPYPTGYGAPTIYGYYPVDARFSGYGGPASYGSYPDMAADPQAVADWLFGRPVSQRTTSDALPVEMAAVIMPAPEQQSQTTEPQEPETPSQLTPAQPPGQTSAVSHIRIETQSGATDATLNADNAQLATVERLQQQQLAVDQKRMEMEASIRKIQRLMYTGVLATIPLIMVLFGVSKKILTEYGKIQRERYAYELERLRQENEQLRAAEKILTREGDHA